MSDVCDDGIAWVSSVGTPHEDARVCTGEIRAVDGTKDELLVSVRESLLLIYVYVVPTHSCSVGDVKKPDLRNREALHLTLVFSCTFFSRDPACPGPGPLSSRYRAPLRQYFSCVCVCQSDLSSPIPCACSASRSRPLQPALSLSWWMLPFAWAFHVSKSVSSALACVSFPPPPKRSVDGLFYPNMYPKASAISYL